MQLLRTATAASCPWCTAPVSLQRKKQCTSLYWDILPPSQQQYSCSFEGQKNKEFLSLLGLSDPLRSLSLRPFNFSSVESSTTHTQTHTQVNLLKGTNKRENANVLLSIFQWRADRQLSKTPSGVHVHKQGIIVPYLYGTGKNKIFPSRNHWQF